MNDQTAIEAFARVDRLRRELREAEARLKLEVAAFSKRRNYGCNLREYQVRSQLELMTKGEAA
jgi:hypothetical protein